MLSIKNVSSQRAKLNSLVVYRDHEIQKWRPPKFRIQISLKDTTSTDVTVLDFIAKRSLLAPERTGSCDDPMKRKVQQLGYSSTPWPSHGTSLTSSRGCTVSLIWFISFSFLSSFLPAFFFFHLFRIIVFIFEIDGIVTSLRIIILEVHGFYYDTWNEKNTRFESKISRETNSSFHLWRKFYKFILILNYKVFPLLLFFHSLWQNIN